MALNKVSTSLVSRDLRVDCGKCVFFRAPDQIAVERAFTLKNSCALQPLIAALQRQLRPAGFVIPEIEKPFLTIFKGEQPFAAGRFAVENGVALQFAAVCADERDFPRANRIRSFRAALKRYAENAETQNETDEGGQQPKIDPAPALWLIKWVTCFHCACLLRDVECEFQAQFAYLAFLFLTIANRQIQYNHAVAFCQCEYGKRIISPALFLIDTKGHAYFSLTTMTLAPVPPDGLVGRTTC